MAIPFLVPAIVAGVSAIAQGIAQRRQNKKNLELAKFQNDANQAAIDRQNAYNTPASQMARYAEAGLNPNLVYSQGNSGNQSGISQYPEIGRPDYGSIAAKLSQDFNQSRLADAQVDAQNAKTVQTYAMTRLNKMQAELIKANPLLNDEGFKATIDSLKMAAELKGTQWNQALTDLRITQNTEAGVTEKVSAELQLLFDRHNLNNADAAIKAEIVKGKAFQNDILEVQKKFMTNGDVTPQHILQFVQLLLLKLISK